MRPDPGSTPTTPRWARVFGLIAIVLAALVLIVVINGAGGPHGPARHMAAHDVGAHAPWALFALLAVLAVAAVALISRAPWSWLPGEQWPQFGLADRGRRVALTAHVVSSVGSLGAVAAFLALALAGLWSADVERARACYVAMEVAAKAAVLPLIVASLVTGIVSSLGSRWGLLQHYWVVVKLLLNVVVLIVLLVQIETINYMAGAAADSRLSESGLFGLRTSLVLHGAGGLLVLIVATVLGLYKPRGLTPYGARKATRAL
jgi:hypothetical protein